MACSPVGLISVMDRALSPVMAKVKVQFLVKPEFFSGSFSTASVVYLTARIISTFTSILYHFWFMMEYPDVDNTSTSFAEKKRVWELHKDIPMVCWKANMVLAWLEVECQMSVYSQMCYENIKSGKVLLELSDSELEAGLGIMNTMHRRKLRLAIEEYRDPAARYITSYTLEPPLKQPPKMNDLAVAFGRRSLMRIINTSTFR